MICKIIGTGIEKYKGKKPYYSTGSIKGGIFTAEGEYDFDKRPSRANRIAVFGQLIDAKMQGTLKVQIIDERLAGALLSTGFYVLNNYLSNIHYIKKVIESPYFQHNKDSKCSGTTQKAITDDELSEILIPLAPLKEQDRIINKIEQIESKIDEFSLFEQKLTMLEFEFSEKLKKSILQYAIEGKLVKQDPNDEPASVLLKRIKAKKEALIKAGKIKRDKNETFIYKGDDKNYYENLPRGWAISKLNSICTKIVDGNHNPPLSLNYKTDYIMLSSQNIGDLGLINLDKVRYIDMKQFLYENERTKITQNDILFTGVGTIGRSCIYRELLNICFQRSVSVIQTLINPEYLKYFFDAPEQQLLFVKEATGTAQKGFYLNQLAKLLVRIPPLCEQKRIVDKINLMLTQIQN